MNKNIIREQEILDAIKKKMGWENAIIIECNYTPNVFTNDVMVEVCILVEDSLFVTEKTFLSTLIDNS